VSAARKQVFTGGDGAVFYRMTFKAPLIFLRSIFKSGKRIGILTGGGDVPGLNSVIKSVVYRGSEIGYEVVGIRRGGKD
jgi:hypothetical protein